LSVLVFFILFTLLAWGASGSIPAYRDSGDLIASIHSLGIAHPPGYAGYVLTGKIFHELIPFGNAAYKTNLFSALWGALAGTGFFYLLRRRVSGIHASLLVCLLISAPAYLMLSRVAEMYTMAIAWMVLILIVLDARHERSPELSAFLLGFGMTVHPTLIALAPLVLLCTPVTVRSWRNSLLFFALGFSICLYMPLRAFQQPVQNWGDPSTWRQFWRVLTRADYGGLKLHPAQSEFFWTPAGIAAQLSYFISAMRAEWGVVALFLGSAGAVLGIRSMADRRWAWGLTLSLLIGGPLFFLLSNLPLQENTTPAILQPYLLIPGVLLLSLVVLLLPKHRLTPLLLVGALLVATPWKSFSVSYRQDFLAYDYGRNLLRSLPVDALLYEPDDPTAFTLRVMQLTENRRPDVIPLNFFRTRWGYTDMRRRWPDLLPPVPIENAQELQKALWGYSATRRAFYAELPQKLEGRPYRTEGIVYRFNGQSPVDRWPLYIRRGADRQADFFSQHLVDYYAAAHCNLGLDYATAGQLARAIHHYRMALTIDPNLAAAWNNWGNLEYSRGRLPEALALYDAGLRRVPGDPGLTANRTLAQNPR